MALHRSAQRQLPVTLLGAGLPQLVARTASAKSDAERLFDFPEIGPLSAEAARLAVEAPANRLGVDFAPEALALVLKETACYPYFLQEWGKHCWDCAEPSTVTLADAETATATATAELDARFFRARFDRLAQSEKRYLWAMAARGGGPHRSGEVAETLGRNVRAVAPTRAKLIAKGMICSPAHGDTAFTVPLFDGYRQPRSAFRTRPRPEGAAGHHQRSTVVTARSWDTGGNGSTQLIVYRLTDGRPMDLACEAAAPTPV